MEQTENIEKVNGIMKMYHVYLSADDPHNRFCMVRLQVVSFLEASSGANSTKMQVVRATTGVTAFP